MNPVDKAIETQLKNIETRTGKTLAELTAIIRNSGLSKHGEIRDMLKRDLGMGHGDANTVIHCAQKIEQPPTEPQPDDMYTGPKAALKPIHEKLMAAVHEFGDFEIAPKKGYLSLRRKKQFAMVGPATNTRVEVGLNLKDFPGTGRLEQLPPKGMCSHKVKLTDAAQVDAELLGWIREAFDAAG